jgi:hypothetical protein
MKERAGERMRLSELKTPLLNPLPARSSRGEEEKVTGLLEFRYVYPDIRHLKSGMFLT